MLSIISSLWLSGKEQLAQVLTVLVRIPFSTTRKSSKQLERGFLSQVLLDMLSLMLEFCNRRNQ